MQCRFAQCLYRDLCYFFIYINDIDHDLFSKICKFADDTKIGRAVATEDEVQSFRDDLQILSKWADAV